MADDSVPPPSAPPVGERLAQALEHVSDAYYALDRDWRYVIFNRAAEQFFGLSRDLVLGRDMWEVFPQGRGGPFEEALRAAMDQGLTRIAETDSVLRPGHRVALTVAPLPDIGVAVILNDVTERQQADERMRLMVGELNHRVKNSMAVVQAIARQTFAASTSLEQAREDFTSRLVALGQAHDVVTAQEWEGADLRELVGRTLAGQLQGRRLTAEGPLIRIPPRMGVNLALGLHELATNAIKHGALSNEHGQVRLTWSCDGTAGAVRLRLRWAESGGPPVIPPRRQGFGTRLLERALATDLGAEVRLRYEPAGLVCDIEAPVAQ
jgi:PAS domain S-box-containing protein